ncbi:MAG: O-methyltransferase [Stackebrandtia sp.]
MSEQVSSDPPLVAAAQAVAAELGFTSSCTPQTGRLLRSAVRSKPGGVVAESGAGCGVGAAWLHSGLAGGARLVTVEHEPDLARRAAALFAHDDRVRVLAGDWKLLVDHAPFDVFFCDGGGKRDDPQQVVDLLAPGGVLLLDDFTPSPHWPPTLGGEIDELRVFYLTHPDLNSSQVQLSPEESAVIAVKRA